MYKFYVYTANNGKEIKKSLLKKGNWEEVFIGLLKHLERRRPR